jgi:hypothetical protein
MEQMVKSMTVIRSCLRHLLFVQQMEHVLHLTRVHASQDLQDHNVKHGHAHLFKRTTLLFAHQTVLVLHLISARVTWGTMVIAARHMTAME